MRPEDRKFSGAGFRIPKKPGILSRELIMGITTGARSEITDILTYLRYINPKHYRSESKESKEIESPILLPQLLTERKCDELLYGSDGIQSLVNLPLLDGRRSPRKRFFLRDFHIQLQLAATTRVYPRHFLPSRRDQMLLIKSGR